MLSQIVIFAVVFATAAATTQHTMELKDSNGQALRTLEVNNMKEGQEVQLVCDASKVTKLGDGSTDADSTAMGLWTKAVISYDGVETKETVAGLSTYTHTYKLRSDKPITVKCRFQKGDTYAAATDSAWSDDFILPRASGNDNQQQTSNDQQAQQYKVCEMKEYVDKKAMDYAEIKNEDLDSAVRQEHKDANDEVKCKTLCFKVDKCRAAMVESSACKLYSSPKTQYSAGKKTFVKECYTSPSFDCKMRDLINYEGQSYAMYYQMTGNDVNNADVCKKNCYEDPRCRAVEFRDNNKCLFYSTSYAKQASGKTLYQKYCANDLQNQEKDQQQRSCEMKDFEGQEAADYAKYNEGSGSSIKDCKQNCFADNNCWATQFETKDKKCLYYRNSKSSAKAGVTMSKKMCGFDAEQQQQTMWNNCQMKDFDNNQGEDYAKYAEKDGNSVDECKRMCFMDAQCKSVELRSNKCFFFSTSTGASKSGVKLSKKLCDPCSQPVHAGSKYCSNNVQRYYYNKGSKRCQAFSYGGCGGTDNNFLSMDECHSVCGESGSFGGFGETCEMKEYKDSEGESYAQYSTIEGNSLDECKQKCFADKLCRGVSYKEKKCYMFSTNKAKIETGRTFAKKLCGADLESSYDQDMSSWENCRMTDKNKASGQDYSNYMTRDGISNKEECKKMCWQDRQCRATELRGNTCWFFNTQASSASSSSTFSYKQCDWDEGSQRYQQNRRMQNNRFCEMKDVESSKGMDYAIYNTEDNKVGDDCRRICWQDPSCMASELRSSTCYFFSTNKEARSPGKVLYKKECQDAEYFQSSFSNQNMQQYQYDSRNMNERRNNLVCTMQTISDQTGKEYAVYDEQDQTSEQVCKSICFEDPKCRATELQSGKCRFYSTFHTDPKAGSNIYKKECNQENEDPNMAQNRAYSQEQCRMRDMHGYAGESYAEYESQPGSDIEECRKLCWNDRLCRGTAHSSGRCLFYNTNHIVTRQGQLYSQKFCQMDPENRQQQQGQQQYQDQGMQLEQCEMNDEMNTEGQQYSFYRQKEATSFEECKRKCFNDYECQSTEFTNNMCKYYKSNRGRGASGKILSRKLCFRKQDNSYKWNQDPSLCEMQDQTNMKGQDYSFYRQSTASSMAECKRKCFNDQECKATEFKNGKECFFFKMNKGTHQTGSELSSKVCKQPSRQTSQQQGQKSSASDEHKHFYDRDECEMRDQSNSKGQDYAQYKTEAGKDFEECKRKCYRDEQCFSTEFRSSQCYFFSNKDGQPATGSTLSRKVCGRDNEGAKMRKERMMCRFEERSNAQGLDYALYREESGSKFDECQRRCYADNNCWSVELDGGKCKFFDSNKIESKTGSTIAVKRCSPVDGQQFNNQNNQFRDFNYDNNNDNNRNNYMRNNMECMMKEASDSKGEDYALYSSFSASDFNECKMKCFDEAKCLSVEMRAKMCMLYRTSQAQRSQGMTLARKVCWQRNNQNEQSRFDRDRECQMRDFQNQQGMDYSVYNTKPSTDFNNCRQWCFQDVECRATELRNSKCYFFGTSRGENKEGALMSKKYCWNNMEQRSPEQDNFNRRPGDCQMRDFSNTKGSDYAFYNQRKASKMDECKQMCYEERKCMATAYVKGNCNFYSTNVGSYQEGSDLSKKFCNDNNFGYDGSFNMMSRMFGRYNNMNSMMSYDRQYNNMNNMNNRGSNAWSDMSNQRMCQMKEFMDAEGQEYSLYNVRAGSKAEDCTRFCFDDQRCLATEFKSSKCYFYSNNRASYKQGATMWKKFCYDDMNALAQRGDGQQERRMQCQMKEFKDSRGQDYAAFSKQSAKDLKECMRQCYADRQCHAVEHRDGKCWFFKTRMATHNSGSTLAKKFCFQSDQEASQQGPRYQCKMEDKEGYKGMDYAVYEEKAGTKMEDCRRRCFYDGHCKATEYRSGKCYLYSNSEAAKMYGRSLSRKTCVVDRPRGSEMIKEDWKDMSREEIIKKMYNIKEMLNGLFDQLKPGCEYTDYKNYRGGYQYMQQMRAQSMDDCKKRCTEMDMCHGVDFDRRMGRCSFYSKDAYSPYSAVGFEYAIKKCDDKNNQNQNQNQFSNRNQGFQQQSPMCKMVESMGMKGDDNTNYDATTAQNFDECKSSCAMDSQCNACEMRGRQCWRFRSSMIQPAASSNNIVAVKRCQDNYGYGGNNMDNMMGNMNNMNQMNSMNNMNNMNMGPSPPMPNNNNNPQSFNNFQRQQNQFPNQWQYNQGNQGNMYQGGMNQPSQNQNAFSFPSNNNNAAQQNCQMNDGMKQSPDQSSFVESVPNMTSLRGNPGTQSCEQECLKRGDACGATTFDSATNTCKIFSSRTRMYDPKGYMLYKDCAGGM